MPQQRQQQQHRVLFAALSIFFFFWFAASRLVSGSNETATAQDNYVLCDQNRYNNGSGFSRNLNTLLATLTTASSSALFGNSSAGLTSSMDVIYGFFQCRGDLTVGNCSRCVSELVEDVQTRKFCPYAIGARIQLDHCYLRYQNTTFFTLGSTDIVNAICNNTQTLDLSFSQSLESLLETVIDRAPQNGGYASSTSGGLYALAQCLAYLSPTDCSLCLHAISNSWATNCGSLNGGRIFAESCYYRYELYLFFTPKIAPSPSPSPSSPRPKGSSRAIILGVTIATASLIMVAVCIIVAIPRLKNRKGSDEEDETIEAVLQRQMAVIFSFEELKVATGLFHADNKLGEGGYGAVFKGTLPDGRVVAVKKLSQTGSHQGKREFMKEVSLLTTVQHKNLVKWLGYSVEGLQRLLVFEYLPNKSLDKFLFDDNVGIILDWATRLGIIMGTARGLAYLHEDSQLRIVHRDIKASNILLDNHLNPKISDFGLARLFPSEQSHLSTRVAGTLGYIAPEYAMHGQLTEKTDIFSFGIVALEIVSGRRNIDLRQAPEKQRLVEWTWQLYQQKRELEVVDPKLGNNFFGEDVRRVVHIALLCTQASAGLRPTMSTVITMLAGRSVTLGKPTQPAFVTLVSSTTSSSTSSTSLPPVILSNAASISDTVEPR